MADKFRRVSLPPVRTLNPRGDILRASAAVLGRRGIGAAKSRDPAKKVAAGRFGGLPRLGIH